MALVPLIPEEAEQLLDAGGAVPGLTLEDERIARLVARGRSAEVIARELHMTERSVYRRLATLRKRLGVSSGAELAARLAERGF